MNFITAFMHHSSWVVANMTALMAALWCLSVFMKILDNATQWAADRWPTVRWIVALDKAFDYGTNALLKLIDLITAMRSRPTS